MYHEMKGFLSTLPVAYTHEESEQVRILTSRFYATQDSEIAFKLAKDIWLLLFVGVSLTLMARYESMRPSFPPWPLLLFIILVATSAVYSACRFGALLPLAGLRFFSLFFVAGVGAWCARDGCLKTLSRMLLLLLAIQFVLAPIELVYGIHMFGYTYTRARIVGTMLQPSSLGITSVLVLAFYLIYSDSGRWRVYAAVIVTTLVFFSGSATALVLLFLLLVLILYRKIPRHYRSLFRIAAVCLGLLMFLLLPEISGRSDVMDSLWGRILPVELYLEQHDPVSLLFGQGLGAGTNAAANLLMNWQTEQAPGYSHFTIFIADATPMALIAQVGISGLIAFYILLVYAAKRDPQAAPVYLLASVASLTTNVTELFPVNMLLGVLLAHSYFITKEGEAYTRI